MGLVLKEVPGDPVVLFAVGGSEGSDKALGAGDGAVRNSVVLDGVFDGGAVGEIASVLQGLDVIPTPAFGLRNPAGEGDGDGW